jgi:CSLREA domain-containing protein
MPTTPLRRLITALAFAIAGAAFASTPAHAADTYHVDSGADTPDASLADARCLTADHECTLRAAIQQANATANPSGSDQIVLDAARIDLTAELPTIDTDMDIRGPGAGQVTLRGDAVHRVLFIASPAHVRISGVAITRGAAPTGGGIVNAGADLTITDCLISLNTAQQGAGVWSAGGALTIVRSTLRDNSTFLGDATSEVAGGGLYTWASNVKIADSTFHRNGAVRGGGLFNRAGAVSITGSTFSGNSSFMDGGAISNAEGTIDLLNSTLVQNSALNKGGGIESSDTVTVRNGTITGNSAKFAGGIYTGESTLLRSTIVAGNSAPTGPDLAGPVFRAVVSEGGNLIGNGAGAALTGSGGPADQVGTASAPIDPKLEPDPQSHGGPTETVAPLPGSPAIDHGADSPAPDTDQRGLPRRRGAHVDAGAYESPNRAPVHTVPGDIQYTGEDTPLVFSEATGNAIAIADPDSTALTTTVSVPARSGTLAGSETVTFSGSPAAITKSLDGLRFTPAPDANGALALTVRTTDNGDGTPDSVETVTDTVAITVRAANDPPRPSDDTLSPVDANAGTRVIPLAELLGNDAAGPANEAGQQLTVTAVKDGAGGTAKLSDGGVDFIPAPGFSGRAEFTYEVQDDGSTNDEDDPRTATAQVRFDVTAPAAVTLTPTPAPAPPRTIAPATVARVSSAAGKVVVVFSKPIDPRTVTIRIRTRGGRTVKTSVRYDSARHRVVAGRLHAGRYVVTIRGAVTGKWRFTVRR